MINLLVEILKGLGLVALILFLLSMIIAIVKTIIIQFTENTKKKKAQDNLKKVFEELVKETEKLEKVKNGTTKKPRKTTKKESK